VLFLHERLSGSLLTVYMPPYYRPRVYLCLPTTVLGCTYASLCVCNGVYASLGVYPGGIPLRCVPGRLYLSGVYQGGYTQGVHRVVYTQGVQRVVHTQCVQGGGIYPGWWCGRYTQGGGCGRYTQGVGVGIPRVGGRLPWCTTRGTVVAILLLGIQGGYTPLGTPPASLLIHYEQAGYTPMQGAGC